MSSAGWYPDPGGAPGQYRYWDGQSWSPTTSPTPGGAPLGQPSGSPKTGLAIGLIVALLLIGIIVFFVIRSGAAGPITTLPEDTNSASPTVPGWDERQPTTPPPIIAPTGGTMVECPTGATASTNTYPRDGWLHGGGLKVKQIPGWTQERVPMGWVYDMSAQTSIYRPGWFSMISVGALHVADGFEDPKVSSFQVMSCFATSSYYQGYSGRQDILSQEVTINGRPGWHLRTEVYVKMPDKPDIEGDIVDVIVVDTGDPESLGVFISSVTIDDQSRIPLVDKAIETLTTR